MQKRTFLERYALVSLILIIALPVFGQDSLDFYPHNLGNFWEYRVIEEVNFTIDTLQNTVVFDSTDSLNRSYFTIKRKILNNSYYTGMWHYFIDENGNIYTAGANFQPSQFIFKDSAELNDIWVVEYQDSVINQIAQVGIVDQDTIFGQPSTIKGIAYYSTTDTTDESLWLWLNTKWFASGFGIIQYRLEPNEFAYLSGAVINGILYGDTTTVTQIPRVQNVFTNDILSVQNYPNPFNSKTDIRFRLSKNTIISLYIFNILGKEVRRLIVNKVYRQGNHVVSWDAKDNEGLSLPSGLYIYRINYGELITTGKMILLN